MNEKMEEVDLLKWQLAMATANNAKLALDLYAKGISEKYKLGPADVVNSEGVITRVQLPAKLESVPAETVAEASPEPAASPG